MQERTSAGETTWALGCAWTAAALTQVVALALVGHLAAEGQRDRDARDGQPGLAASNQPWWQQQHCAAMVR